jgi:hypothetical protein
MLISLKSEPGYSISLLVAEHGAEQPGVRQRLDHSSTGMRARFAPAASLVLPVFVSI